MGLPDMTEAAGSTPAGHGTVPEDSLNVTDSESVRPGPLRDNSSPTP